MHRCILRPEPVVNGAEAVWACLRQEGVDTVFGYPGGAVLPLYDALLEAPIRHVLVRHEQGAAHMADGYARATGQVGVVLATSGPGATNLVTGLATAMMDSVPLVALTGQVRSGLLGTDAFQEVDTVGIMLPVTKHAVMVTRATDIVPALREAFALARSGRPGPVLVDITVDAQRETVSFDWESAAPTRHLRAAIPPPEASDLDAAVAMLREARRPLLLAGRGILMAGASRELVALAERADVPVASTLLGLSALSASHPLHLGMMGMHGGAWTNEAIQEADLLVALGMRFDDRVTGSLATYAPGARKIHVDIDPSEFHKNVPVDLAIRGDLRPVLEGLLARLPEPLSHRAWTSHLADRRRATGSLPDTGDTLTAPRVFQELAAATEGRALVVTDVGQHQMWEAQSYGHERVGGLITSGGLGTMGFSLPAALGAALGQPDAEVWSVSGDGGFQMNLQELGTLVQEGAKVCVAVLNNGFLGMVRQWQELFHGGRYSATPMLNPDFAGLAGAYGIPGRVATTVAEAREAIQAARACPGPFFVEFRIAPEAGVFPMVPAGAALDQMITGPRA